MLVEQLYYGLAGVFLFVLGAAYTFLPGQAIRRILAINVAGAGLFLLLISIAYQGIGQTADPLPHALVLTGIVVAFSATALAIALIRLLERVSNEHE